MDQELSKDLENPTPEMKPKERHYYKAMRPDGSGKAPITEDTPLTPDEQRFVTEYIRTSSGVKAAELAGITLDKNKRIFAQTIMQRPNVQKEIQRCMKELHDESVATAAEVMKYFTSVMRGEIKDQFGLDAPLSERTKAAQELARRTVDIDNRKAGVADQTVAIKLDWNRE